MASAARTIRAVKPHVPMIRFPSRSKVGEKAASTIQLTEPPSQESKVKSGSATGTIDFIDLPLKYQRKPISQEEIDYITNGGPL